MQVSNQSIQNTDWFKEETIQFEFQLNPAFPSLLG